MKRVILIVVIALVVVAGGAAYYLYSSLDSLIQQAIEKYGSEATKAEVTLNRAEVDPLSGSGALRGLTVGNPEGFEAPSALELGAISVNLDVGTVASDPVVIKEIAIDKPDITYELNDSGSNVAAIQKNAEDYMAKHGLAGGGGEGPKLIIENLYIRGGTVNVSAGILKGKTLSAPLPDIHLKDIGKEKNGATPAEVAERIVKSITGGATAAVAGLGIGETLDSLKQHLGGLTGGVGKSLGGVTKGMGDITKGVTEGMGGVTKGIGKTLGDVTKGVTGSSGGAAGSSGGTSGGLGGSVGEAGKKLKGLFGN